MEGEKVRRIENRCICTSNLRNDRKKREARRREEKKQIVGKFATLVWQNRRWIERAEEGMEMMARYFEAHLILLVRRENVQILHVDYNFIL